MCLRGRISQKKQKQIEECFGWLKTIALLRKLRHRELFKLEWAFTVASRPSIPLQFRWSHERYCSDSFILPHYRKKYLVRYECS